MGISVIFFTFSLCIFSIFVVFALVKNCIFTIKNILIYNQKTEFSNFPLILHHGSGCRCTRKKHLFFFKSISIYFPQIYHLKLVEVAEGPSTLLPFKALEALEKFISQLLSDTDVGVKQQDDRNQGGVIVNQERKKQFDVYSFLRYRPPSVSSY